LGLPSAPLNISAWPRRFNAPSSDDIAQKQATHAGPSHPAHRTSMVLQDLLGKVLCQATLGSESWCPIQPHPCFCPTCDQLPPDTTCAVCTTLPVHTVGQRMRAATSLQPQRQHVTKFGASSLRSSGRPGRRTHHHLNVVVHRRFADFVIAISRSSVRVHSDLVLPSFMLSTSMSHTIFSSP